MSAADDHHTEAPGILLSSKVLQNRYSFSTRRKSNSSSATTSMSLFKEDESTQREMNEGTEATLTLSRTRLPNFSSDETEILLTEVETMFHRRTAGNRDPLALRRSKWQEIADKISAVSGMAREPKHLKKKLNDLRRRVRTRLAKIQADKRTRGAPSPSSRLSRLDERVLAIMPDLARSAVTGVDTLHMQLRSLEGKQPGCRMSPVLSLSSDYETDNQSTSSLDRPMEEGHATPYLLQRHGVTAPKGQSGPGARNMRSHDKAAPKVQSPISEGGGREAGPSRARLGTGSVHAEFLPSREPTETPSSHPRHSTQASPQRAPLQGQKEAERCISSHELLAFQQGLKGAMEAGFCSIGSHLADIHRDLVRLDSTMSWMSDRLDANFATLAEALQEWRPTSAPTPPESVRLYSSQSSSSPRIPRAPAASAAEPF